jgi:hypothetical protein
MSTPSSMAGSSTVQPFKIAATSGDCWLCARGTGSLPTGKRMPNRNEKVFAEEFQT